ncbi:uncharacterized protein BT62DRAFT_1010939 [Guyanagaster necrorhizus]|uniref:Uncharacterized protein n=1 Tax=Guyanagaster necrorhizus TaxID=856835 RepID=A0A9P7VK08_9AGAR|nr:uncharacterized protein BT62DRAFT_1010939 [Guyanagaster necrorhizus MCA 3950]KAG7441912.1 hypothetical protein BT62DRAFT_1010939 [Guyanagaster necrorhizus MCA 3950]
MFIWVTDIQAFTHCCPSCHHSLQQRYGLSPVRAQHIEVQVLKGNWKRTRLWVKVINIWIGILLKPSEGTTIIEYGLPGIFQHSVTGQELQAQISDYDLGPPEEDVNSSPRSLSLLHVAFVGINEFSQLSGYLIVVKKDGFARNQTSIFGPKELSIVSLSANTFCCLPKRHPALSVVPRRTDPFQVIYTLETPVGAVTDETLTNVVKKRTNRRDMSRTRGQNNGLSDSHTFRDRHSQSDLQDIMSRFWTPTTMASLFSTGGSDTTESTSEKLQFNRAIGSLTWTSILRLTFQSASTAIPGYSRRRARNRSLELTEIIIALLVDSILFPSAVLVLHLTMPFLTVMGTIMANDKR